MNANQSPAIEAIRTPALAARYLAAYDTLLQKWPVPYESLHIATLYGSTHVIASGPVDAPPLVLLHGLEATALVWRANVTDLSRHFRVYAVDVLGQGGKSRSIRKFGGRQGMADWMSELFDALAIEQASIVGNSYGGFLAMNQASLAPERVKQVVLINSVGVFASVVPLLLGMVWMLLLQALRLRARPEKLLISHMLGSNVQLNEDDAEWEAMLALVLFSGEVKINATFPAKFSDAELAAICPPVLLLMGDNDFLYDAVATLHLAQRRMPSLQAQLVPGAHHIAAMAKPEEVNRMIIDFLLLPV